MASHYEAETNVDERLEMRAEGQPSVIIATPGGHETGSLSQLEVDVSFNVEQPEQGLETINELEEITENNEGGSMHLPPLQVTNVNTPTKRKPLPPIDTNLVAPSRGGQAEYPAGDTIISVPQGGGSAPSQTSHGMISMPGRTSESSRVGKPVETIIYLMDKTGIHFNVDDGQKAEAGELFEYVMEELQLPAEAREVFSLWLVSDLLELQLKPNHIPFKLACYWDELLEKYTSAPQEDVERDEPILMFQRNVFYSRSKEQKLTSPEIVRLLYTEAKENVIDSRYPLKQSECDYLAGLQAHIEQRGYYGTTHTPAFYKDKLSQYYPTRFARRKKSLFSSEEQPEERLAAWHRAASRKLDKQSMVDAYRLYLQFCWKLPYYGAAFFRGQIEHPGQAVFKSVKDDPVYVAINPCGVFILDMDDSLFLLGLLYEDMSWEYAEPCNKSNKNCIPCLFMQFQEKEQGECVSKILQIFSREAKLMDAMIDTCIEVKKAKNCGCDEVDALDDDGDGILKADKDTWKQFNRLSLSTVKGGKCVNSSLKRPSTKKKKN